MIQPSRVSSIQPIRSNQQQYLVFQLRYLVFQFRWNNSWAWLSLASLALCFMFLGHATAKDTETTFQERKVEVIDAGTNPGSNTAWQGQLISLGETTASFSTGNSSKQIEFTNMRRVVFVDHLPETQLDQIAMLRDGSELPFKSLVLQAGKSAELTLSDGTQFSLAPENLADVRFKKLTPAQQTQWESIRSSRLSADMLVLIRSEEVLDKIEGVVSDITSEIVNFEFSGQTVPAPILKLAGLRFFSNRESSFAKLMAIVHDVHGGSWQVQKLNLNANDDAITVTLRSGAELQLPINSIREIDFSVGSQKYLSELATVDRTTQNRLAVAKLVKGNDEVFGAKSPSTSGESDIEFYGAGTVTYRVPEGFTQLAGTVELAPPGNKITPCLIQVLVERKVVWETTLTENRKPESISIPVKEDNRVQLVVTSQSVLPVGDVVVFRGIRLLK